MNRTPNSTSAAAILVRVGLSIVLAFCIYLVAVQAVAGWYFEQGTAKAVQKAIRWDPRNPEYYASLAGLAETRPQASDLGEAISLYKRATQLSPYDADYWARLGQVYGWAGQSESAQRAYERAKLLFPNSPVINWKLGNFYLRQGEVDKALRAFRTTILEDPSMRWAAFDVAWQAAGDAEQIASVMIPPRADVLLEYLSYLVKTGRMDEAAQVWGRIHRLNSDFEPKALFPYLDALIRQRRIDELVAVWTQMTERNPERARKHGFDVNLVTNGDFETEILDGGLDWRVIPAAGAIVSVDALTFFDGGHSLRVEFDGKQNLDYQNVFQYVPVKPSTSYRFLAYMRAESVTTDSGPRFQVRDAYDSATLFVQTDNLLGAAAWSPQQSEFKTGPDTCLLVIALTRPPSGKFDNRIAGTIWVDHVALNEID